MSETEGIPGVLLEAGLLGLPVVATKVGGVPGGVVDGETGLLVDREDDDEVVDAPVRLAEDPALRARMGERARRRVEGQRAIARLAGDFLDFCRRVGDSASGGSPFQGRGGSGFAPETRLLGLGARPQLDAAAAEGIRELIGRDLDWRRLFAAAPRHKLTPLLAHQLRAFGSTLPDDVYEAWGGWSSWEAARCSSRPARSPPGPATRCGSRPGAPVPVGLESEPHWCRRAPPAVAPCLPVRFLPLGGPGL